MVIKMPGHLKIVVQTTNTLKIPHSHLTLHYIAEIRAHWVETNLLRSITLDIITRLLDNAAFVCIHVVERFSKDFSEVRGLKSRGFQLQVEWMTTALCAEL